MISPRPEPRNQALPLPWVRVKLTQQQWEKLPVAARHAISTLIVQHTRMKERLNAHEEVVSASDS